MDLELFSDGAILFAGRKKKVLQEILRNAIRRKLPEASFESWGPGPVISLHFTTPEEVLNIPGNFYQEMGLHRVLTAHPAHGSTGHRNTVYFSFFLTRAIFPAQT